MAYDRLDEMPPTASEVLDELVDGVSVDIDGDGEDDIEATFEGGRFSIRGMSDLGKLVILMVVILAGVASKYMGMW